MNTATPIAAAGRRRVLQAAAATGIAAAAWPQSASAAVAAAPASSIAPAAPADDGSAYTNNDPAWLLARRATSGATPELVKEIKAAGALTWLNDQLAPGRIDDSKYEALAARFAWRDQPVWAIHQTQIENQLGKAGSRGPYGLTEDVLHEHVCRLLWSRRQLQAVMTDFWANHFNVTLQRGREGGRMHYQGVLRRFALGSFTDLLTAISRHPAMLSYLNNKKSTLDHPNENQGRELLELHTIGVGNYSETDVLNATRVLTGLSVGPESGRYEYKPWFHWTGPVKVLSWTHPNDSQDSGYQAAASLFEYLATHELTARRVATQLAAYFVSDDPPESLIAKLMNTYLDNRTAIGPVLRQLFTSEEFAQSHGQVTRRPLESILATVRALGLQLDGYGAEGIADLAEAAATAGHLPLGYPSPDGFPYPAQKWASSASTLSVWNITYDLATDVWPATLRRESSLLRRIHPTTLPASHGAFVDNLCLRFFGRTLAPADRTAVLTFLAVSDGSALTAASPVVTKQLPDLVTLLLSSAYHRYR